MKYLILLHILILYIYKYYEKKNTNGDVLHLSLTTGGDGKVLALDGNVSYRRMLYQRKGRRRRRGRGRGTRGRRAKKLERRRKAQRRKARREEKKRKRQRKRAERKRKRKERKKRRQEKKERKKEKKRRKKEEKALQKERERKQNNEQEIDSNLNSKQNEHDEVGQDGSEYLSKDGNNYVHHQNGPNTASPGGAGGILSPRNNAEKIGQNNNLYGRNGEPIDTDKLHPALYEEGNHEEISDEYDNSGQTGTSTADGDNNLGSPHESQLGGNVKVIHFDKLKRKPKNIIINKIKGILNMLE
ncbi:hypothetical protein PGO_020800 [Plasmodium gonderi]|uniref:Uncharacterized protein n=1 Tax=Plasmodium gonderi TaxID=77519 RepID=A0A1Y1JA17_PLAGO|nr:hypothetical protein PGO_020800 [Plasmodium gonderi]GAW79110.1 hypothetical protein PGO_020800 [Plasmodium gonderi]